MVLGRFSSFGFQTFLQAVKVFLRAFQFVIQTITERVDPAPAKISQTYVKTKFVYSLVVSGSVVRTVFT